MPDAQTEANDATGTKAETPAGSIRLSISFDDGATASSVSFDSSTDLVTVGGPLAAGQLCLAHGLIDDVRRHAKAPQIEDLIGEARAFLRDKAKAAEARNPA